MALAQLDISHSQEELATVLGTRPGIGTPFSRIARLNSSQIDIRLAEWGGLETLLQAIQPSQIAIVAIVTTPELPGWENLRTQHTLLITAITQTTITYHDPALTSGPTTLPLGDFHLAWSEMSEAVAIITRMS